VDNFIFDPAHHPQNLNMEKETGFSHLEGLEIIQSMINRAKDKFTENGHLYLIWGWVVFVCSITQFMLMNYTRFEKHYLVWLVCWLVFIYQIFYIAKREKRKQVRTYTGDIIGYVWIAFVVAMFLMGFLFGRVLGDQYYRMVSPGFLVLYGIPTFLSGVIIRFKPLVIGGISCWILSVISVFVPPNYQLLFLSAAMLVAWIIPGYLLRLKYNKTNR
jgi:hypothetical protein